jgi:hypothetical protein
MKMKLAFITQALERNSYRLGLLIIAVSLITLVSILTGCSDDDDKKSTDSRSALVGTWVLGANGSVVKDDVDVTAEYDGLQLTFSDAGTYTAVNSTPLWQSSGTWSWTGTGATALTLDGDFDVTVTTLEAQSLVLHFTLQADDLDAGRSASLAGNYTVTLTAAP